MSDAESINLWSNIWWWMIVLGGGAYALLMLYIIIIGPLDIFHMYRRLREIKKSDDDAEAKAKEDAAAKAKDDEEKEAAARR